MARARMGLAMACALAGAGCAAVATGPEAHWQALASADLAAARRMILEDHPGTARETGDRAFVERERRAWDTAVRRAGTVRDMDGYAATLTGYANDLGDRHIGVVFAYRADTRQWTGIVPALRGERFVVHSDRPAPGRASLVGAELVSCDGIPADAIARARLGGFRASWGIRAQRERSAPLLLVDDGNPFVPRPARCRFVRDGVASDVALAWQPIARPELAPLLAQAVDDGRAGFGVRPFAGGWWIAMESFDDRAGAVVAQARTQAPALHGAARVVVDLRGNGGGNDVYGRHLADVLFGRERVAAALGPEGAAATCPSIWRTSMRNVARLQELGRLIREPQTQRIIDAALAAIGVARLGGRELSGAPACAPAEAVATERLPPPVARGTVFLLTDNACFSSCLSVVRMFRRLGAVHVGRETNANTHYSEVRGDRLPSGLATFHTLQALIPDAPRNYGPFVPVHAYAGRMADTAALEAWIGRLATDWSAARWSSTTTPPRSTACGIRSAA